MKLVKIKSIKRIENSSKKYDLAVRKNHNFFANGILVHNCSTWYSDYIHARSVDGRNHVSRNWLKNFHAQNCFNIPENWRICGENVFARHSIEYSGLPSYFLVFCIYNEKNICLSWDETTEYAQLLNLEQVPVLYRGIYDEDAVRNCFTGRSQFGNSEQEGYVIRFADSIPWALHRNGFAKFVRKGHVQTSHNWMMERVVQNKLKNNC